MVVQYKPKPTIFNNFLKGYLFKKNPLRAVLKNRGQKSRDTAPLSVTHT